MTVINAENIVRLLAFYLPQYHPTPENDEWWGKGFTEWTNVVKAKPLFPGHYQPHIPADLGFYDLRLPESRIAQAELAREYGIYGFCYYHYWFNGRRILERPFSEVLSSGAPDFPFCLCWANENWTRVWDGGDTNVLLQQHYSLEDDERHIRSLLPAMADHRYVKINNKSLLLVYRAELLPEPKRTADCWRSIALKHGLGELYLARVEGFRGDIAPGDIGFDAAVEFAPDWLNKGNPLCRDFMAKFASKLGLKSKCFKFNEVTCYDDMVRLMLAKNEKPYPWLRCVTPGFDNSPRRSVNAAIITGANPDSYGSWLRSLIERVKRNSKHDEQIIFINAWNEWGEGNHLEPDLRWGRAFLEATRKALHT